MIDIKLKKEYLTGRNIFVATGDDSEFFCRECMKSISKGFVCENDRDKIWCEKCHAEESMSDCPHDSIGEHKHIKFKRDFI